MGYKLRPARSIVNPYDGSVNTTAYAIIDFGSIDKEHQEARFELVVYASYEARVAKFAPLYKYSIGAKEAEFVTYFSPSLTTNIWAQVHTYLINGGLASTPLVTADWILDARAEP